MYQCYQDNEVPTSIYGQKQCDALYPVVNSLNGLPYLECLKSKKIFYSYKQVCEWIYKDINGDVGNYYYILLCLKDGCLDPTSDPPKCISELRQKKDYGYCLMQAK